MKRISTLVEVVCDGCCKVISTDGKSIEPPLVNVNGKMFTMHFIDPTLDTGDDDCQCGKPLDICRACINTMAVGW